VGVIWVREKELETLTTTSLFRSGTVLFSCLFTSERWHAQEDEKLVIALIRGFEEWIRDEKVGATAGL